VYSEQCTAPSCSEQFIVSGEILENLKKKAMSACSVDTLWCVVKLKV
jgi:hypothetical protein